MNATPDTGAAVKPLHHPFWCVRSGPAEDVTVVKSSKKVIITVKGENPAKPITLEVHIPVLENTCELAAGDELVVLKEEKGQDDDEAGGPESKAKAKAKKQKEGKKSDPSTGTSAASGAPAAKKQRKK